MSELSLDTEFLLAVEAKVSKIRNNLDDLPKIAAKGYRFKSDEFVRKLVVRIMIKLRDCDPNDIKIPQQLRGLTTDHLVGTKEEVLSGSFDQLIEKSLLQAAEYDYLSEKDLKKH